MTADDGQAARDVEIVAVEELPPAVLRLRHGQKARLEPRDGLARGLPEGAHEAELEVVLLRPLRVLFGVLDVDAVRPQRFTAESALVRRALRRDVLVAERSRVGVLEPREARLVVQMC